MHGSGQPVVFIQGSGVHGACWKPQLDGLKNEFQCLSFDNRGMGASQPLAVTVLTIERMAADTIALMDAMGWRSAHVAGHSMGGLIAICLALKNPDRVKTLALLCSFANGRDAVAMSASKIWLGLRTYIGTRRMRRHAFLEMVFPQTLIRSSDRDELAARMAPLFGHDLADHPPVVLKQLAAMKRYDATARLGELSGIPTLVLAAGQDRIAPFDSSRSMAGAIPGAAFHGYPEAGHGLPIQLADEVNRQLRNHFRSVA